MAHIGEKNGLSLVSGLGCFHCLLQIQSALGNSLFEFGIDLAQFLLQLFALGNILRCADILRHMTCFVPFEYTVATIKPAPFSTRMTQPVFNF